MSFMEPQITSKMVWVEAETPEGTIYVPADEWEEDFGKRIGEIVGYGSRLSAPGYMDCTEWSVHETAAEAAEELLSSYYDQADDEMTEDERAEAAWLQGIIDGE